MEIIAPICLILFLAAATYAVVLAIQRLRQSGSGKRGLVPPLFPLVMPKHTHWQRTTAVVERSITRATDALAHQVSAARQLEAAEYALHCLLDELSDVMKTAVGSPLRVTKHIPSVMQSNTPTAMAA